MERNYSDHEGLRGNWGKSCNPTDSIMAHAQTLGMGIFVPDEYLCQEMPCDSLNDAFYYSTSEWIFEILSYLFQ